MTQPMPLHLLGVPFNSAGRPDGVARAPRALREAGLVEALAASVPLLVDRGDTSLEAAEPRRDPETHLIGPHALARMISAVRTEVAAGLAAGAFPLVVGGDCPILLGCLGATGINHPPGLLFVDGHEDAWPPASSTTGEAADMELGLALGLTVEGLPDGLIRQIPRLDPRRVLVIGPRDGRELARAGVASIRDRVQVIGPEVLDDRWPVVDTAIAELARQGPWWLHVDLDVLSTDSLAAVDYRLPGGLTWEQLERLTTTVIARPGLIGWDVTIYNPDLDPDRSGARAIIRYFSASLDRGPRPSGARC